MVLRSRVESEDRGVWVERLVERPNDPAVLKQLEQFLYEDPSALAAIYEAAAMDAQHRFAASRFLVRAAQLRLSVLGERRRGVALLKAALEQDSENRAAAAVLTEAHADALNHPALEAMYRSRAESLAQLARKDPSLGPRAGKAYMKLGRFYADSARDAKAAEVAFDRARRFEQGRVSVSPILSVGVALPEPPPLLFPHSLPPPPVVERRTTPPLGSVAPDAAPAGTDMPTIPRAPAVPALVAPHPSRDVGEALALAHTEFAPPRAASAPLRVHLPKAALAPVAPSARVWRPSTEGLMAALFEALHDLSFCDDAFSGARWLAATLAEQVDATTVLVHLYDINAGEFVVVGAHGRAAEKLVDLRTTEADPLLSEAMADGAEALVVASPSGDERLSRGRWAVLDPAVSVLCVSAERGGRFLGAIELVDPERGTPFDEHERNALTYAGESLAAFLETRGIVFSD